MAPAAAPDLERLHRRIDSLEVVVDADVEHPHRDAVLGGEHRDAGSSGQERAHHGRRDRLRIGRDAVVGDVVVAGEDDRADAIDRLGRNGTLGGGDPDGQVTQPAEGARGSGQTGQTFGRPDSNLGRGGLDGVHRLLARSRRAVAADSRSYSRPMSPARAIPITPHIVASVISDARRKNQSVSPGNSPISLTVGSSNPATMTMTRYDAPGDDQRAIGADRLDQSERQHHRTDGSQDRDALHREELERAGRDRVLVADGRRRAGVLEEGYESEGDEADQCDEGGRLARAESSEPAGGEGRDESDDSAQRDRDREGAGGESPGGLVLARHLRAGILVRVAIGGWILGVLGGVGSGGLLDRDGGVDLGLTDRVGDGEGEESGDQAREESANQEVAWGHEGVRSSSATRPDAVVSAGSMGGVDQWQG